MSSITSLGVGSGLDLETLVTNLMSAEQAPLAAIQKKQASVNTKISSLGTLKSKLADLQSAGNALKADIGKTSLEKFATYSATSSTSTVASATVGTGAVAGNYDLVVSKLAQAQRFTSNVYTATNSAIGIDGDTLTFAFATPDAEGNSRTKTITLDSTNNSLAGLRNSINGAKMGVTATIINGSAGAQLVLSGQEGLDNEITLSGSLKLSPPRLFTSTSSYAATTAAVGVIGNTLSFDFGTPPIVGGPLSKTITLTSGNNKLAGLRDAINAEGMGITASIVSVGGAFKLVFAEQSGAVNKITLGGNLATALTPSTFGISQTVAAQNAEFTVNGIAASSSSNNSSKVLDGVSLKLSTLGSTTLSIVSDYSEKMTANLNSFITAFNAANSTMKTMGAYNAGTKTAGALQGNSILRDAQMQTHNLIYDTKVGGSSTYQRLSDIGVSLGTDGSLSLNASKLTTALAADPSATSALLSKIGSEFSTTIEKFVSFSGKIKVATDSSSSFIKELTSRSDALQRRLVTVEARYRKQFSSLDTLIAGLNSTSSYLTQQLAGLSN